MNHLVGNIQADHLPGLLSVIDRFGQQAAGPSRAAAQVEHFVARLEVHHGQRLLGDGDVVVLHLLAFALLGPLVEFLA